MQSFNLRKFLTYIIIVSSLLSFAACNNTVEHMSSSSFSSEYVDIFKPTLRVCNADVFTKRPNDYIYDYETQKMFTYTFIEEDENYLYLTYKTGLEFSLPKSCSHLKDSNFVCINKATGEKELIDTRVASDFTTIKDDMIYYYKITNNNINAVLMEYNIKTKTTSKANIEGLFCNLVSCDSSIINIEYEDHIDWFYQKIQDAGENKYLYQDYGNKSCYVVNTHNDAQYKLPADNYYNEFICEYDGKYYYGMYNGEYDNSFGRWTSGPKTFTLYRCETESNDTKTVCSIDFSSEDRSVKIGYKYVGNGCIFIWNQEMFGKYWIYDIKTDELILKKNDKQYGGLFRDYWYSYLTFDYDDAFYFVECMDEDYNCSIQRVTYNGLNQETLIDIPIDIYSNIKICNGYIYVYGFQHYPHDLEIIMRYNIDGSNPVEIIYNCYEATTIPLKE